jgi:PAS domain-containing protein
LHGAIQVANRRACEFLGYTRENSRSATIAALHGESAVALLGERYEQFQRGLEVRFRSTVWRKNGEALPG